MSDRHADVVIVGASHAGGEISSRLRQGGFTGTIALLGAEPYLPYQRPPLSKAFLAGDMTVEQLLIRSPESYAKAGIDWHPSTVVESIDRTTHSLRLGNGEAFGYGKLVLATGGRPRRLSIPGSELQGLHYMRTIADVDALRPGFTAGAKLVIVGGGYIGLEVAAVAVKHGLDVEIVEFAPRVLARVAGPELSAFYEAAHRAAGVKLRLSTGVEGFDPAPGKPGHAGAVRCADGTVLPADLVLVAVGLVPNIELARDAGLAMGNGIVVDEFTQTSDPDILAIGDCTEHPLPFLGGQRVRLESVPNAVEQARVAASALNGQPKAYAAVPWFWSDQYNLKLQSVGLSHGHDRVVIRPARTPEGFVCFYLKDGRMIAADCVNSIPEFNAAKRLVTEKTIVDPAALADPAVELKSLLAAKV
ncbi:NAD(P)/FAD-dependent oxidoreductase [Acidocella sp.]|uniref:NAD(P)/FAD-dependent oxidoreductase n=1 Tax=Acidocella sp. TaxID=50710 RepID=UPI0017D598FD|nr:FAD-dependent oxidoreductase [Acidocella sp.]NNM56556.1 FAD-dependent oxidoreductase [Acidocella sp.]